MSTYGSYAAQAYLRNSSPITYVRLLGDASPNNAGDGADGTPSANGGAGWKVGVAPSNSALGTAYGLFVMNSSSNSQFRATAGTALPTTGALAAIIYATTGSFQLSGVLGGTNTPGQATNALVKTDTAGNFTLKYVTGTGVGGNVNVFSNTTAGESIIINLNRTSKNYIRNVMNTNPTRTNSSITTNSETYFVGGICDT